ncbi:MAG: hypothetical protein MK108_13530 [Mariniblastus sp.]|nr:hypothetical protein [Mariniblastus sp.]
MDRSFLADPGVIRASRDFVCIRTATYEDKQEAKFLQQTLFGGGDQMRNFGFCILSPDGQRKLKQSRRGPNFAYRDANEMGTDMRRIARQYATAQGKPIQGLPQMKSVRLALNVASCDGLPCLVVYGNEPQRVEQLSRKLDSVIWEDELMGKYIFASTRQRADLKSIEGAGRSQGILLVAPNPYGTAGQLIEMIGGEVTAEELKEVLLKAAERYERPVKEHGNHVRYGRRNGVNWETEVDVPDRRRFNNRR